MATRKAAAVQKEPTLAPGRAIRAIQQQLDALQKLKDRRYDEADAEETEWEHVTRGIIELAFGDPSTSLNKFHMATAAGHHNMMGTSPRQQQINFEMRIKAHEALLRSLIATLRLQLPEEEIKGVYEPGDEYAFYRDLTVIVQAATQGVLFVDAYLSEEVFNLYVSKVPDGVPVRLLSNKIGANVETVAKMFARNRPLELRSSGDIHDRAIFLGQRGWITGQSIKDAAKKKPTYLIELDEPLLTSSKDIYERIWRGATVVI
ncbi:MAG: hypothetical protein C5B51_02920 [Terriglobia bacterium]|nr:MAG: hypothetical protein C5B51_02920 [Terriglobia bacterium]